MGRAHETDTRRAGLDWLCAGQCGVSLRISCQRSDLDISSVIFELNGVKAIDGPSTEAEPKIYLRRPGRRAPRALVCVRNTSPARHARARRPRLARRARLPLPRRRQRFAQLDPFNRQAGTRCWRQRARQAHCARARRVPRACGRWTAPRLRRGNRSARAVALARWRAWPFSCCGIEWAGIAAVVRCGTGPTERARCFPPISGFSRAALTRSRA